MGRYHNYNMDYAMKIIINYQKAITIALVPYPSMAATGLDGLARQILFYFICMLLRYLLLKNLFFGVFFSATSDVNSSETVHPN